jgi:hypothetical protein
LIIELLRPGSADLGRRWLAALMLVPERERQAVVEAIEARLVSTYAPLSARQAGAHAEESADDRVQFRLHARPVQRDGYVEEVIRDIEVVRAPAGERPRAQKKRVERGAPG